MYIHMDTHMYIHFNMYVYALYRTEPYLAHAHTARGHGCIEGTPHHVGEQTLDKWSSVEGRKEGR